MLEGVFEVETLFGRDHLDQIGSFSLFVYNITVAREDQLRIEGIFDNQNTVK
jgi:hypothetical protein